MKVLPSFGDLNVTLKCYAHLTVFIPCYITLTNATRSGKGTFIVIDDYYNTGYDTGCVWPAQGTRT
jgi:hypothetical protein